jgi:hypothetical protein
VLGAVPVAGWTWVTLACSWLLSDLAYDRRRCVYALGGRCSDLLAGRMAWVLVGLEWRCRSVMPMGKCRCCTVHMRFSVYPAHIAVVVVLVTVAAWVVSCTMWVMFMLIYLLVCFLCVREPFAHQRRDLSHCWQLCGVSAFAVGGRAVSGRADSRTPAGACGLLAVSHRWGPAAPLAISQVRCRRSMGSVIARVKVALRAHLDRQGKH